ncbi:MAG: haloacid dehalogenase-like hydrolase [Oscillospiraceae bacterium]|nr:haloacid dehalogenase-like hydrolase [Oscillospiraceae bacterium]
MNVYDFDETIFHPDSSQSFLLYCLRHHSLAVSKALPKVIVQFLLYLKDGRRDAQNLKEALFSFLNRIDNIDRVVEEFWEEHYDRISAWYLEQKRPDDLIISASPAFLLQPAADRLAVRLIATDMNPYTGRIRGRNCHDTEKVRRYLKEYPTEAVEEFYSDSLSDTPMAKLAVRAFLVTGEERIPWPDI